MRFVDVNGDGDTRRIGRGRTTFTYDNGRALGDVSRRTEMAIIFAGNFLVLVLLYLNRVAGEDVL